RLLDQSRAEPEGVSGPEVAETIAHRVDRGHIRRPHDHAGRSPRLAAAARRCAGPQMKENFGTIVVADFEYETSDGDHNLHPGDLPVPLCLVAYVLDEHLQHVRTVRMWRDDLSSATRPPFDIDDNSVFVAYAAQAELTCFKVLGWPFPRHVFDL